MIENISNNCSSDTYLISYSNKVTYVGNGLCHITGYTRSEIINKNIDQIFMDMFHLHKEKFTYLDEACKIDCFLFTKALEALEVTVTVSKDNETNIKKIHICEKLNSRLENKLIFVEQIFKENTHGANVFSVPDFLVLKSNQKYLDLNSHPYSKIENVIGKPISEIFFGYEGNQINTNLNKVIQTHKTVYFNEYINSNINSNSTHLSSIFTPVFENGELKYIFEVVTDITEKIKSRELIDKKIRSLVTSNQNEDIYQIMFENISEGFSLSEVIYGEAGDPCDFRFIDVNRAYEEQTGLKAKDITGKTLLEIAPDMEKSWIEMLGSVAITGEPVRFEDYNVSTDKYYETIIFSPVKDKVALFIKDISDRKAADTKLNDEKSHAEKKAHQLNNILENLTDGIAVADDKGNVVSLNPVALRMFGIKYIDEYKNIKDFDNYFEFYDINGQQIPFEQRPMCKALRGETFKDYVMYLCHKENNNSWIGSYSGSPIYDKNDKPHMAIITFRDITKQIDAENKLKESEMKFRQLFEHMTNGFALNEVVYNEKGEVDDFRYLMINKAFENCMNQNSENIVGRTIKEINPFADNEMIKAYCNVALTGEPINLEYYSKTFNKYFLVYCFCPKIGQFASVFEDISIRKKVEIDMQHSIELAEKANKAKDEFISLISHEFKTPLTVINSSIQAMQFLCKNELSDKANGFLNKILQNSNRQLKLVNNLLDITRINAGYINMNTANLEIVSLTKDITDSIKILVNQMGVNLSFCSSIQRRVMALDEEKYERILLNLLSNAIKFTPKGKSIQVKISQKVINEITMVCIQVVDNGIGIPLDKQKLIFERFGQVDNSFTRQAEGSGIGLSLVKMLVELLDGEISLESIEGEGSIFSVYLPVKKVGKISVKNYEGTNTRLSQAKAIEFSDIYT